MTKTMANVAEALRVSADALAARKPDFRIRVVDCARCQGIHDSVPFYKFGAPPSFATHWAMCPNSEDPILMEVKNQ